VFFTVAVLSLFPSAVLPTLLSHLALIPAFVLRGELWELGTYSFLNSGLLSTLFSMLFLWFVGAMLEAERGSRWLYELYFTSAVGGAILASLLALVPVLHLGTQVIAAGPYAATLGLMVAVGLLFGEQEFVFWFVLRLKAKYLTAIMILIAFARLFLGDDRFGALVQLCAAASAYGFMRFAPRRGLAYGLQERFFGLRNEFYRNKRRRAARKFEVYMREQNREVRFDKDGRFIDPDEDRNNRRDPTDKRWMN
ncbi:MAG: rhomboid family intramembrane serine protease, partial [Janthinobacterium lividum]